MVSTWLLEELWWQTGAAAGIKNFFARSSGPLLALAAASVVLVEVAEKFGIFGSKAEELEEK